MISRQAVRLLSRQQQQQTLLRREANPLVYCSSSTLATTTTTTTTTIPSTPRTSTAWTPPSTSTIAPRGFTVVSATAQSLSPSSSQARCWFSSSSSSSSNSTSGTTSTTNGEEKAEEPTAAASDDDTAEDHQNSEQQQGLELEIKQLKDQLLRSYAEQENTRNIAKRDVREARQFAIKSFAKSLLEVADNLERALDHSNNNNSSNGGSETTTTTADPAASLKALQQGIEMTHAGLVKALQQHGVEKYCEVPGDKFDPALHNALMQYPDPTKAAADVDTVGQVIKAGYTLNQRVLRPAEVGVAVAVKK